MFIFGHMGIGSLLARPLSLGLRKRWLLVGTLLPDLMDKPLYYGLSTITGLRGAELGLISGSRTFGHTALLLLALTLAAYWRESKVLAALAIGMATHLFLDNLGDHFNGVSGFQFDPASSTLAALLFPFLGFHFPVMPYASVEEHAGSIFQSYALWGEIIGASLLAWDYWKRQHQPEIMDEIREDRIRRKLAKKSRKKQIKA